jgi:hypothetical protein
MRPVTVMALFCEDIREEKDEVITLVGIIPDTVNVATSRKERSGLTAIGVDTRVLAKLCMYVRINFDPDYELPEPKIRLIQPDNVSIELGTIDAATVQKARSDAKSKGNLLAGVISRVTLGGFKLPRTGTLKLEVQLEKEVHLAGALNFQAKPPASSNDSQQPS